MGGVFKEEVYGMRVRPKMHTGEEGDMLRERRNIFYPSSASRLHLLTCQFSLNLAYFTLSTVPEELVIN